MNLTGRFARFILVLFVFYSSVSAQADEAKIIENKIADWTTAFVNKDVAKALSIYSEDFIGYYPDQPDQNYKSIKDQYQHILTNKNLAVKLESKVDEIHVSGNLAFVRVVITATIKPAMATEPAIAHDKGIQIWQKENNGEWKLLRSSTFPFNTK
ncbi:MAG: DUF4440 domain-containing protein [Bacteroidota bacterium]